NSFAGSDEAKGIFPALKNPKAATDAQVVSYVDTMYQNLFGRTADQSGESYWTGQVKQAIASGQPLGSFAITIVNGAGGNDIIAVLNKAEVNIAYVNEQNELHTQWGASDLPGAVALMAAVTSDPHSALVGIKQADTLIQADAH